MFLNRVLVGLSTSQSSHLPKCQLLTGYLPFMRKPPSPKGSKFNVFTVTGVSLMNMVFTFENKHKWHHFTSLEIPREETQTQWKILEGYKLHIKILELWERWKNSRCKTQQGGRFCIKAIKIYNRFNGQLFFAFVRWLEFACDCQMPWWRPAIRWMAGLSFHLTPPHPSPSSTLSHFGKSEDMLIWDRTVLWVIHLHSSGGGGADVL
jgi:hypothetical protein